MIISETSPKTLISHKTNIKVNVSIYNKLEVGGTVRFLLISLAWVIFAGKCTPYQGLKLILKFSHFSSIATQKSEKNTSFLF